MILVDTSVWADHFRSGEPVLQALLTEGRVASHPFVVGELALGNLRDWEDTVASLCELPQLGVSSHDAFLALVAREGLIASGLGYVDAHLLASIRDNGGVRLWTRDKRLAAKARAMDAAWSEPAA